jgi:hypothetical protein
MRKHVLSFALVAVAALALPATGLAKVVHLEAHLSGKQEVPAADADGSGKADIRLNAKKGKVCYEITTKHINGASAAHIHAGRKGTSGDVLVPLFAGTGGSKLEGCVKDIAKSTIKGITKHPKRFYVNVHNTDFPNGAIRGQLHKS